jgi:hypothetical protein
MQICNGNTLHMTFHVRGLYDMESNGGGAEPDCVGHVSDCVGRLHSAVVRKSYENDHTCSKVQFAIYSDKLPNGIAKVRLKG